MSRGSVAVAPGSSAHVFAPEDPNKSYGSRKAFCLQRRLGRGSQEPGRRAGGTIDTEATSTRILTTILQPITGDFVNGDAGWLRVELLDPTKTPPSRQLNNEIPNVLIRAEMPILAFEPESGRLQDVFLQLTEETIQ
ncbi:hypothetical protein P9217_19395 [Mesorhizobium sp. WSM4989]|nr:hypothetical protein [Mesorhizobium sp. WSM4989]